MTAPAEGTPIWADAMFGELEGAKRFYGDVLGWTFGETSSEYGNYTQAFSDGKAVAAVVPPMPGQEGQSAWCLYLASSDAAATVGRIRENGGEVLMEPMRVGDFGTMALAREPAGAVFGVWQGGTHEGFEATARPGAYCWADVFSREPEKTDAFLTAVFPYRAQRMADSEVDFVVFRNREGGDRVLGRMRMTEDFPPEVPSYINVNFGVDDCDAAVRRATDRGGVLRFGPMDTPFGRFAALSDPQGAAFTVIDMARSEGPMPKLVDVT
ncbi:VOC family protein [Streptomyces jietaisiensis]|uniref:VOC family protein n=1 Tax=Streptomyces griseoaurantiacus TaxID=68213 RepID=UPI003245A9F2